MKIVATHQAKKITSLPPVGFGTYFISNHDNARSYSGHKP